METKTKQNTRQDETRQEKIGRLSEALRKVEL